MAIFSRYIGVDYSGAETPTSSLKGLRVYMAECERPASEVLPPPSPRKYWTPDQNDAYAVATWLQQADHDDRLQVAFRPKLSSSERAVAGVEGWILGVG
jgi:hypothetical protein